MKNYAKRILRISGFAAALAALPIQVAAATLEGGVTYKAPGTGRPAPLVAAVVSVFNAATQRKTITKTNDGGRYVFQSLPNGSYLILVEKDGRRVYQGKVEVREAGTRFDIQL
jgi:hypothetical protein